MRRLSYRSICTAAIALSGVVAVLVSGPAPASAAGAVAGTVVVGKGGLAVRLAATSTSGKVTLLKNKTKVNIACQVTGDYVKGRVRKTNKWDRLTNGQYVSDAFIKRSTRTAIATCPPPPPPAVAPPSLTGPAINLELNAGEWIIPVPKVNIGGFRTLARPEHDGVDLSHPRNTPIRSVAAGTVVTVKCNTSGPSCDVDGSPSTSGCGWYVQVRHVGDVVTRYCHMIRKPEVAEGDVVIKGQIIGYVGTSGHSSGPHLHFEVHLGHPAVRANAVDPVQFMRQAGAPLN
jgi:murein DD-endopeptidase MepM/ murein hydrolase activator NlpD